MILDKITFILENCDSVTIDGKYIGSFNVEDIRTTISRVACNAIMKMECAHTFFVEIHKDADEKYFEFGQNDSRFEQEKFKRLLVDDITAIEFDLVDQYAKEGEEPRREHYDYYVEWTGDNDYVNASSHSFISDLGHLYIFIGPEEKYSEFIDKDVLNDKDAIDFKFKMYGIGNENYKELMRQEEETNEEGKEKEEEKDTKK